MTRRLQHVFFDVTDTLLRVRGSVGAVYAPVAARHGLHVTAAEIDHRFRPAIASAPPPAFPGAEASALDALERGWWRDVVARTFESFGPFPEFETFFDEVFELFRTTEPWEPMPGLFEALEALRAQGRRLAIVSEMDARVYDAFRAFGLSAFFEHVVLSTRVGASKRDGSIFRRALEITGARPESAVHVGDSLRGDVEGARAAGLTAIHIDPEALGRGPFGVPRVRSLLEVPARIAQLENA